MKFFSIMRLSSHRIKLIAKYMNFFAWYQKKLNLSDYELLWLTFLKGTLVAQLLERLIGH